MPAPINSRLRFLVKPSVPSLRLPAPPLALNGDFIAETREEIMISSLAASLRRMVKRGAVSQAEADRQLGEYVERLRREPFAPDFRPFMAARPGRAGTRFVDPGKEAAVAGSITGDGLLNLVPAGKLIPPEAFVDEFCRTLYGAARAVLARGCTVCLMSVNDELAASGESKRIARVVDPSGKASPDVWRQWPERVDLSLSGCFKPDPVVYCLGELAELYVKRQTAAIGARLQSGEIGPLDAQKELAALHSPNGGFPPVLSATELCMHPPPTPPEVIGGILHQGSKMVVGGGSKSFKTWILLELAINISSGLPWLGFDTASGPVIYLNFELPDFAITARINAICAAMKIPVPKELRTWNLRGYAANASVLLPELASQIKEYGYIASFIDPLYKLLGGRDDNAAGQITDLMNTVDRFALDTKTAPIFGNHYAKGNAAAKEAIDRISGSGVYARDPDSILTLTAHEEPSAFTLEMVLRNFPPQDPFVIRRQHPLMAVDSKLDPAKLKKPAGGRDPEYGVKDILAALNEALITVDWQKACEEDGIPQRTFYRLKKQAVKERRVFKSEFDKKWSLKP